MGEHTTLISTGDIVAPLPLPDQPVRWPTVDTALPLPTLPQHGRTSGAVYALARIDASGRVADHTTPTALHWDVGDLLAAHVEGDQTITVAAGPRGGTTLSPKRHVVLPAALRHVCGMHTGDLLFLVALPHRGILRIHSLAYLDTLYTARRS